MIRPLPSCLLLVSLVWCASCSPGATEPSSAVKVTSISPSAGSTTGGTTVTITGTGFLSDAAVTLGGLAPSSVTIQSSTTLIAVTAPRPSAGTIDVAVTSGGRTATLTGRFTVVAPTTVNPPPVVTSVRSIGSRPNQPAEFVDLGETITLVATVTDSETAPSSLSYVWTGPGTIVGSGSSVSWQAPSTVLTPTPAPTTVSLGVIESFTEGSITHRNVVTSSIVMQVHDSQNEIMSLGEDFLTLFSQSDQTTDQVLHNFSPTCDRGGGRDAEAGDVDRAHELYVQDFSKFRISRRPPVTFNFRGTCPVPGTDRVMFNVDGCSSYDVHWEVTYKADGRREITDGIDWVTAVVENNRWRLCHSNFTGQSVARSGLKRFVVW